MKKRLILVLCVVLALTVVLGACGSKSSATKVTSPEDFPDHKIAVQVETTADISVTKLNTKDNIEIERYEKVTQCFDELSLGRADAVYVDSVVASYYTKDSDKYERSWLSETPEPMAVCLNKDNPELAAAVDAAIDTLYFNGTMAVIAKANFGEDFTADLRDITEQPDFPAFTTKTPGVLTVGMEVGYPPMEYTTEDGQTFIGFDVDVAKAVAELLGLQVEYVNTSWDGIFAGLEKNQYDCIMSSVSITPERDEAYILTKPYVANRLCIVVKNSK
jgi:ABC-type amino acid transport substrate-binding protein